MSIPEPIQKAPISVPPETTFREVHLIGVCGSGMKPLAHALQSMGVQITGSDPAAEKGSDLVENGARLYAEHSAGNLSDPDAVVYSSAIPSDNPELVEARHRGISIIHRSEMLAWFLSQKESLLIAGTHGKTTTTAMATIIFDAGKVDPWGFIGGEVPCYRGNLRIGGGAMAIAEADESDGTFLNLPRDHAIITNIEAEHLNYWGTEARIFEGFESFVSGIPDSGVLIVCGDDPGVRRLTPRIHRPFVEYSLRDTEAAFRSCVRDLTGSGSVFDLYIDGKRAVRVQLSVPGRQNIANATAALAMAASLGIELEHVTEALAEFRGVNRRFTRRQADSGFLVIDDYGHHPTEIAATMSAARLLADERGGELHVIFQPHRYTRTQNFFSSFGGALSGADSLILTDIYAAGELPIEGVTATNLKLEIERDLGCPVDHITDFTEIKKNARERVKDDDIVLLLGAGSVTKLSNLLITC